MFSRYHKWFVELGYPQLDIEEYEDGEWAIIEYLGQTVVPSEVRWNVILSGLRHIEPSFSFVKNYIDTEVGLRKLFEIHKDIETTKIAMDKEKEDRRVQDLADRATALVKRNEAMYNRVAKNGLHELNLHELAKHIPRFHQEAKHI